MQDLFDGIIGPGLVKRWLSVASGDVVFVKGVFEASEGLGGLSARRGGQLMAFAPASRESELDELLRDLLSDLPGARLCWEHCDSTCDPLA